MQVRRGAGTPHSTGREWTHGDATGRKAPRRHAGSWHSHALLRARRDGHACPLNDDAPTAAGSISGRSGARGRLPPVASTASGPERPEGAEPVVATGEAADRPLLLVDGNSLAYRAFFALPETITTSDGFPTNALYGLAAMMVKVLSEEHPGRVVVAWDPAGGTFRNDLYDEYKAGRRETPDLLREQKRLFRPLMEAFGFVNAELTGYEADDVIGTLARSAAESGERVMILTGDRDALQLVDERVTVLATGRGVTDVTRYTPEAVRERYGVGPELMVDFRGLVGDPSDNLPGVPGIGEKGAAQLIAKYGGLEEVLAHAGEQSPKRRENLTAHADDARLTARLAAIATDAPVGWTSRRCRRSISARPAPPSSARCSTGWSSRAFGAASPTSPAVPRRRPR